MNKNLISKIFQKIKKTPTDIAAYEDLFALCRNIEQEDVTPIPLHQRGTSQGGYSGNKAPKKC